MDKEYDLRMEDTPDDEFDEVEETTEYNDVDEDDGEYEYEEEESEEPEEDYEEEPEEEYDEEEEYPEEDYAEEEYPEEDYEEEPYEEEQPEEEEYYEEPEEYEEEPVAAAEDYSDRFEQILSELKNLNQSLTDNRVPAPAAPVQPQPQMQYPMNPYYPQQQQQMPQPNQASPNFSCTYSVPQQQQPASMYADPVLTSEVSRIRDEVLRSSVQQNMQQNNTVLAEISRMREEMARQSSQSIQYEIMQLKHDLANNSRYQQPAAPVPPVAYPPYLYQQPVAPAAPVQQQAQPAAPVAPIAAQPAPQPAAPQPNIENLFMQNELSRLREEMGKGDITAMNSEVARLREEMTKKELRESMNTELTQIKKEMDAKSELTSVREEMNRLKQELVDAINEKKHRSAVEAEPRPQVVMQAAPAPAGAEVLDMVRELREEMRREREEAQREREWARERERREREEARRNDALPTTAAARTNDNAIAVLEEIKKLREEVAANSVNSSAVISKKIDSVLRGGVEEEKRTQEILRAIGKMFVQSNNAMKGMTDKNETMLKSFTEELRRNLDELGSVKEEIGQVDVAGLREDIEQLSARSRSDMAAACDKSNRELASEIGEQLGALAKDVISKVGDKSRQEEMYNGLLNLDKKVDMSLRAQAKAYQDTSHMNAAMVKLMKSNKAELTEKLDEAAASLKSVRADLDKLDEFSAGTERAVNFVVDSLTEQVEELKQDLKRNPSAFTDAGKVLAEVEQLKTSVKNLTAGAATRTDVENTAVRLRNSIMSDIKNVDLAASVTAVVEKLKQEIADANAQSAKQMAEASASTLKQLEDSNEQLARRVAEADEKLAKQVYGATVQAEEQDRKAQVMMGGIAKMIAKNNSLLKDILNESGKSITAIAGGQKLTSESLEELKDSIAAIAGRDLSELASIKKALTKLDDTEAVVAEINSRMANINREVAKTVDTLKEEVRKQLSDAERYSDVNKALEVVKSEVADCVDRLMSRGVEGMRKELSNEVYAAVNGSMADVTKSIDSSNEKILKAIDRVDTTAVDPLVAEVKKAIEEGREERKALGDMVKRNERMEQRQAEQHEKTVSMFTSMARALARTNDAVGMLRSAAQKDLETISASGAVTRDELTKLRQTVEKVSADYADSLREMKRELAGVSGGQAVVKALDDKLENLSDDMAKAISSLKEDVARRIADADKSETVSRALDTMSRDLKKELDANLERNAAAFTEISKRTEEIKRAQDESARRTGSLYNGVAKAMVATSREIASVKEDVSALRESSGKAFGELKNDLVGINDAAAGELKAMVDGQIEKLYQEIKTKLNNGEMNEQMLRQINALKQLVLESSEEKAEALQKNLEFQLNGMLTTLSGKATASDAVLDAVSLKLNELANALAKNNNEQIDAVLSALSEKMDGLTKELKEDPAAADQLAKRIAAIKQELSARIDAQEAKLVDSLETQVREIKTSLVDVLGQNEMIDSIAKNVRDVKEGLGKDIKRIEKELSSNTVSNDLVQELISQINLLSEYMLQDNKSDTSAAVATQIAELKNKISSSRSDQDLAAIRDEIVSLKNSLGKSRVNDDVLVNLIDQVNQLAKDSKEGMGGGKEMEKVVASIGELNDQVQNLAKSVDLLKNKDMIAQSTGADIRMRATQVMLDKLTEIKFALEDAIRKTNDKEKAIGMVKAVDKLTNQLGFQSGLKAPAGKLTQALGDLTDDLNEIPKK